MLASNQLLLNIIANLLFFISITNSKCTNKGLLINHDLSSWLRSNNIVNFYEQFYKVTQNEHVLAIELSNLKILANRFSNDSVLSNNASCFTLFQTNLIVVDQQKYETVDEFLKENKVNEIGKCSFNLSLPCSLNNFNLLSKMVTNNHLFILSRNEDLVRYSFPSKYQIDFLNASFNNSKGLLNSVKVIFQFRYSLITNESFDIFKEHFVTFNSRLKYFVKTKANVIDNLSLNLINTNQVYKNSTLISLKWVLRDMFSFCNIDYYLISSTNFLNYQTIEFRTDSFQSKDEYKSFCRQAANLNITNEKLKQVRLNNAHNESVKCMINKTADFIFMIDCELQVDALNALCSYNVQAFDKFGMNFWAHELTTPMPTDISLPQVNVKLEYFKNDFVDHHITINIKCPQIGQNNGTIVKSYLFLVKLGERSENKTRNYSIDFDPNNQQELVEFVNKRINCLENSTIFEPCLLNEFDRYGRDGIDFMNPIEICISDKRLNVIESSSFKFLVHKIIKESNYYQLFFVFKLANLYEINKQPIKANSLYFSSQITEPLLVYNEASKETNKNFILLGSIPIAFLFVFIVAIIIFSYTHRNHSKTFGLCFLNVFKNESNMKKYGFEANSVTETSGDQKMTKLWQNKNQTEEKMRKEFEKLPEYTNKYSTNISNEAKNANKNRYFNVKPFDNNRVILKKPDGNDYINASFVPGYFKERKFIATQAPLKSTFNDFWIMIDQYKVETIVMLTNLVEFNVSKCDQYWPTKLNDSQMYGSIEITFLSEEVFPDFLKRVYKLVNIEENKDERQITQYFYSEWVDKSVPSTDLISIFHLINQINLNNQKKAPIVVHCSAGAGRTGTYIALDAMVEKLQVENKIDVFNFVRKLREKRTSLVQTLSQYVYIYEALNEMKIYGLTEMKVEQILVELNESNNKSARIKSEYEKLSNKTSFKNCFENTRFEFESSKQSNEINNIQLSLVNQPRAQVYTTSLPSNFSFKLYLYLNGHDENQKNKYDFYKDLFDTSCNVVVSIVPDVSLINNMSIWPSEENRKIQHHFDGETIEIKLVDTQNESSYLKSRVQITNLKTNKQRKVYRYILNENSMRNLTEFDERILVELVNHLKKKRSKSSVMILSNQYSDYCIFSVLLSAFYQLKVFRTLDLCRLVKLVNSTIQNEENVQLSLQTFSAIYDLMIKIVKTDLLASN